MDLAPAPSPFATLSADLRLILRGLLAVLGGWRVTPAVAVAFYNRVVRIAERIERLLVRFQRGALWRVAQRKPGARCGGGRAAVLLPRRFGWLVALGGHHAAGFGSQLQHVLAAPEMAALLAASPQAGRILRPLCRALAVDVPGVSVAPCAAKVERCEKAPRVRKPRPKPEPFRIPLPRGVLSAARRAGFGKWC